MMKNISKFLVLIFLLLSAIEMEAQPGTWRNYMAYSDIKWVEQDRQYLYVLASNNLYRYNTKDKSIQYYDKLTGLTSTDIYFIAWNKVARRLVIVYYDYTIDLLDEKGNVTTIFSYKTKTMTEDKTINSIYTYNQYCYVSTGFGVLKIDVAKGVIQDTYKLGVKVDKTYIANGYIYACSVKDGCFRALLTDNLLDHNNWKRVGEYKHSAQQYDKKLYEQVKNIKPIGPRRNHFFYMQYLNDRLYTTAGLFESGATNLYEPGEVQVLDKNQQWTIYQNDIAIKTRRNYEDMNCLAVDPKNPNHVFVGGRTGLYEFLNGKFKTAYDTKNSPLMHAVENKKELDDNYILVNGLLYDKKGSLWILNCQTFSTSLLELKPNGKFVTHNKPELMHSGLSLVVMRQPIQDSRNLIWFVNYNWQLPALFCYDPATDKLVRYTKFINQDHEQLAIRDVSCVVEDIDGNMWVGTNVGPLMLKKELIGKGSDIEFEQVKIARNDGTDLADYLLSDVGITSIAIDKAGRKWFGTTNNGVYLISADGQKQIHHFLSFTTPLLSDIIESIAIDHSNGEVFFGTDKGLCSYMGDATEPVNDPNSDITYAYPNPVTPDYTGPITVVGLAANSEVRVVTVNGTLVAKGCSNGGTYVWDGNDLNGQRVASGIYMVQAVTELGKHGIVCRIAIVNN